MVPHIPSLHTPLKLPVKVFKLDGNPKIIAGGVPVTPINVVLGRRRKLKNASDESLDAYTRAGRLYAEFCAHLGRSIIDISDADFGTFKCALTGGEFKNSTGELSRIVGTRRRGPRTADLMLSLIYSIAEDVEELYMEHFDWLRRGPALCSMPGRGSTRGNHNLFLSSSRLHRIGWVPKKIVGLPDDQFALMIDAARDIWGNTIADGDVAYSGDPESRRGALFYRNAAILFLLRYEGCRRCEPTFVEFGDIRREESEINLVTKGHGGELGERLPVLLFSFVDEIIWRYVVRFRPVPSGLHEKAPQRIFLSHSVRNYGQPISKETVRKIVDTLRERLDPPWDERVTPHALRHAFARDLQRHGGPLSLTANMRHKNLNSSRPYMAGVEAFSEELGPRFEEEFRQIISRTGLLPFLAGEGD